MYHYPFCLPYRNYEEEIMFLVFSSYKVIVENVLSCFKSFACLNTKWCHNRDLHFFVFYIIAEIINIDMHFNPVR